MTVTWALGRPDILKKLWLTFVWLLLFNSEVENPSKWPRDVFYPIPRSFEISVQKHKISFNAKTQLRKKLNLCPIRESSRSVLAQNSLGQLLFNEQIWKKLFVKKTQKPGGCKATMIKHHFLIGKMNYVYSLAAFGRFQGRENNLIGEITCHYMFCFIFCMTNQDY